MINRLTIPDVQVQFCSLNRHGERIGVIDGFGKPFRDKRYSVFNKKGGRSNHFQGVQRLGQYLLVTGSMPHGKKRGDLLVVHLGSRPADPGPWGSNLMRDRDPPRVDALRKYFAIDREYWHPGGFSLLDSTAAVPLENSKGESKVVFLDLTTPGQPSLLPSVIHRADYKAGACCITPVPDERLLLAVWSDSDRPKSGSADAPYHLDLYVSKTKGSLTDFAFVAQFFPPAGHAFHRKFQSIDFLWQAANGGGQDRLFLVGFENTSDAQPSPLDPGENKAYLFEVAVSQLPVAAGATAQLQQLGDDFITLLASREFDTSGNWCNMDAGSCAYVDSNQQLIVYSVYHFLAPMRSVQFSGNLVLKCLEFRATEFTDAVAGLEDAWVELYEDPGLQGRRLALLGPWDSSIENADRIFVDDKPFEATASARFQLPVGTAFVLYREPEYHGGRALVLQGTGARRAIDVHVAGFGGEFGSCRLQPLSVASALPGARLV
jgi:hypothetical protein